MTTSTSIFTDEFLDQARHRGDPLADNIVKTIYESGELDAVNQVLRQLSANKRATLEMQHPILLDYFMQTAELPDGFDHDRLARVQTFFKQYDLQVMAGLIFASLPMCYAAEKGAHVLVKTYRSTHNPRRRVFESAQLVIDLLGEDSIDATGKGIRSLQKVRLLHAAVRHLLLNNHDWDTDFYGIPINQEDLAATLGMFIFPVLDSLPLLGIKITPQEYADYVYVWQQFGQMLGVEAALIPTDPAQHRALVEQMKQRHFAASEDGHELARTLTEMIQNELVPGAVRDIPPAMMYYLLGDDIAALLGIERSLWVNVLKPFRWALPFIETGMTSSMANQAAQVVCRNLFNSLTEAEIHQNRASFSIPDHLTKSWKLADIIDEIMQEQDEDAAHQS